MFCDFVNIEQTKQNHAMTLILLHELVELLSERWFVQLNPHVFGKIVIYKKDSNKIFKKCLSQC